MKRTSSSSLSPFFWQRKRLQKRIPASRFSGPDHVNEVASDDVRPNPAGFYVASLKSMDDRSMFTAIAVTIHLTNQGKLIRLPHVKPMTSMAECRAWTHQQEFMRETPRLSRHLPLLRLRIRTMMLQGLAVTPEPMTAPLLAGPRSSRSGPFRRSARASICRASTAPVSARRRRARMCMDRRLGRYLRDRTAANPPSVPEAACLQTAPERPVREAPHVSQIVKSHAALKRT